MRKVIKHLVLSYCLALVAYYLTLIAWGMIQGETVIDSELIQWSFVVCLFALIAPVLEAALYFSTKRKGVSISGYGIVLLVLSLWCGYVIVEGELHGPGIALLALAVTVIPGLVMIWPILRRT